MGNIQAAILMPSQLHSSAQGALRSLGENLRTARKRRNETQEEFGRRIGVSRQTIAQVEAGDPQVAMGTYASVLWVLGMHEQLVELAAPSTDVQGQASEIEHLPQRVRRQRASGEYNF